MVGIENIEFGRLNYLKKDCPRNNKCMSPTPEITKKHQLCMICSLLQQILAELQKN